MCVVGLLSVLNLNFVKYNSSNKSSVMSVLDLNFAEHSSSLSDGAQTGQLILGLYGHS